MTKKHRDKRKALRWYISRIKAINFVKDELTKITSIELPNMLQMMLYKENKK